MLPNSSPPYRALPAEPPGNSIHINKNDIVMLSEVIVAAHTKTRITTVCYSNKEW